MLSSPLILDEVKAALSVLKLSPFMNKIAFGCPQVGCKPQHLMAVILELMGEVKEKQSAVHKGVGNSPKHQFGNCMY